MFQIINSHSNMQEQPPHTHPLSLNAQGSDSVATIINQKPTRQMDRIICTNENDADKRHDRPTSSQIY